MMAPLSVSLGLSWYAHCTGHSLIILSDACFTHSNKDMYVFQEISIAQDFALVLITSE